MGERLVQRTSTAVDELEVLMRRDKQLLVPLEPVELWNDPKRATRR
jgi:hypothetical protein